MGLYDTIDGLREVVEGENRVRDASLIGLPDRICGFYVRLLTLEDYIALRLIRNPFIVGGQPSPEAVYEFLKRIMPDGRSRRGLIRKCRACRIPRMPLIHTRRAMARWEARVMSALKNLAEMCQAIAAYVEESVQDWPSPGGAADDEDGSIYGLGVSFCSMLLREYDWPFEKTLREPLKVVLQCVKEIQFSKGQRAFCSPSKLHINKWLLTRN